MMIWRHEERLEWLEAELCVDSMQLVEEEETGREEEKECVKVDRRELQRGRFHLHEGLSLTWWRR